jgi:predicted MFS family arabinose efflux permease
MTRTHRTRTIITLGTAQTLAWASSYYLPAMLAAPMARDLGVSTPTVFGAFSVALIVSALVGPGAGRLIDRAGGRPLLMATNGLFALGLLALGSAPNAWALFGAWALLGVAMGSGLYEAAFATLVRLYGADSRNPITGITLIAGLASTVGWPLTTLLEAQFGWRGACFAWAALHLLIGLPLNAALPRAAVGADAAALGGAGEQSDASAPIALPARPQFTAAVLAFVFATAWFVATAMAAHLPRLLQAAGATLAVAVGVAALVGPAQVAGRLLEFGVLRRVHPLLSARLAALGHPLGAAALLLLGAPAATLFVVLHGAGNGMLTIAKGTLPLVLFGPQGYGVRQGWITMPARASQALAPFAFDTAIDRWGADALWLSAALVLSAFVALMALPHPRPAAAPAKTG